MTRSVLLVLLAAAPAFAQSPPPASCSIALPYNAAEVADCSPRSAAAYDFAFCGTTYLMSAMAAPQPGPGPEAIKQKGGLYVKISEALTDVAMLKRNVELTKAYYESLQKQPAVMESALEQVGVKCRTIDAHHAAVLQELAERAKDRPKKIE